MTDQRVPRFTRVAGKARTRYPEMLYIVPDVYLTRSLAGRGRRMDAG